MSRKSTMLIKFGGIQKMISNQESRPRVINRCDSRSKFWATDFAASASFSATRRASFSAFRSDSNFNSLIFISSISASNRNFWSENSSSYLKRRSNLRKFQKIEIKKPAVLAVHARFELLPTHRVGSIGPEWWNNVLLFLIRPTGQWLILVTLWSKTRTYASYDDAALCYKCNIEKYNRKICI